MRMFSEIFIAIFIMIFLGYLSWKFLITLIFFFVISTVFFDFLFKKNCLSLEKFQIKFTAKCLKMSTMFLMVILILKFSIKKIFLNRAITASKKAAITEAKFEIIPTLQNIILS